MQVDKEEKPLGTGRRTQRFFFTSPLNNHNQLFMSLWKRGMEPWRFRGTNDSRFTAVLPALRPDECLSSENDLFWTCRVVLKMNLENVTTAFGLWRQEDAFWQYGMWRWWWQWCRYSQWWDHAISRDHSNGGGCCGKYEEEEKEEEREHADGDPE